MNGLPTWIQVLQALLTPAIGLGVGVIAFLQWRTAHQKVILDLFDRRLRVYETTINAVLGYIHRHDGFDGNRVLSDLRRSYTEARFLFGDEVAERIEDLSDTIFKHRRLERKIDSKHIADDERNELIDEASDVEDHLQKMVIPWTELLLPYLKMDQKRVPTPAEWLSYRNRIRLSYTDEKQK